MSEQQYSRESRTGGEGSQAEESSANQGPLGVLLERFGPAGAQAILRRKQVQRRAKAAGGGDANVQEAAAKGTSGAAGSLPHLDAIQRSFGRHQVAGVKAHVDEAAAQGAAAMGAEAFATGDHVAFGRGAPSLHTAAHEAAHIIQQRAGVHLKGGVGEEGDPHEQHADAVADKVASGESAEEMLDQYGDGGAESTASGPVQMTREKLAPVAVDGKAGVSIQKIRDSLVLVAAQIAELEGEEEIDRDRLAGWQAQGDAAVLRLEGLEPDAYAMSWEAADVGVSPQCRAFKEALVALGLARSALNKSFEKVSADRENQALMQQEGEKEKEYAKKGKGKHEKNPDNDSKSSGSGAGGLSGAKLNDEQQQRFDAIQALKVHICEGEKGSTGLAGCHSLSGGSAAIFQQDLATKKAIGASGVYSCDVTLKKGGGKPKMSTFFPDAWSWENIVEAYVFSSRVGSVRESSKKQYAGVFFESKGDTIYPVADQ